MNRNSGPIVYLSLTATTLFWGLSFVATKLALETIHPAHLLFFRFAAAGILLLFLLPRRALLVLTLRDHLLLFATAAFEPGLYFFFETMALQRIYAAEASLIVATIPMVVLLLSTIFLGEKNSWKVGAGIVLSIAGVAVLAFLGEKSAMKSSSSAQGYLLMFGAVVTASAYITLARNLTRRLSALLVTVMQVVYGAVFFAPGAFLKRGAFSLSDIRFRSMAGLVFLVLFATVGAFFCYNFALTRIKAAVASVYLNGIPLVTAAAAWILLGERLSYAQAAGGGLILLSVYLVNTYSQEEAPAPEPLLQ